MFINALSWSLMATFVDNKYNVVFCILLGSFSIAFSNREHAMSHKEPEDLFSLYVGVLWPLEEFGSLLDTYGVRFFFDVTTLLPLLAPTIVILVKEQPMFSTTKGENIPFARLDKQLCSLTLLCSTLPQILLVLPLWFWDMSKLYFAIGSQHIPFGASPQDV
ncbi:Folate-biopterin transporter 1, chloroplastic, partial [Mucuna pruriens]